jgi:hypothetical protein
MNWLEILQLSSQVVGTAAVVATMTPNKTDNAVVNTAMQFINILGANFGQAKNKESGCKIKSSKRQTRCALSAACCL